MSPQPHPGLHGAGSDVVVTGAIDVLVVDGSTIVVSVLGTVVSVVSVVGTVVSVTGTVVSVVSVTGAVVSVVSVDGTVTSVDDEGSVDAVSATRTEDAGTCPPDTPQATPPESTAASAADATPTRRRRPFTFPPNVAKTVRCTIGEKPVETEAHADAASCAVPAPRRGQLAS